MLEGALALDLKKRTHSPDEHAHKVINDSILQKL